MAKKKKEKIIGEVQEIKKEEKIGFIVGEEIEVDGEWCKVELVGTTAKGEEYVALKRGERTQRWLVSVLLDYLKGLVDVEGRPK